VQLHTVKALLTEAAMRRVQPAHYRFCSNAVCDVVYFSDAGDHFPTADVRVPVWQKMPVGVRLLCYCFGETEPLIEAELIERGRTDAVDRIRDCIAAERCACDIRNPRGACCLSDVVAAVNRLQADVLLRNKDR
jgi:hypothetical protein